MLKSSKWEKDENIKKMKFWKFPVDLQPEAVQSPIAISSCASKIHDNLQPLKFHGHWHKDGKAFIENTGISAKVTFQNRNEQPFVNGGALQPNERYIFEEIHFHWSERDDAGCEHKINGQT